MEATVAAVGPHPMSGMQPSGVRGFGAVPGACSNLIVPHEGANPDSNVPWAPFAVVLSPTFGALTVEGIPYANHPERTLMATIDNVSLDPGDLVNKWGFGDGDMAIDILHQWVQTTPCRQLLQAEHQDHPIWQYYSYRALLMELVEQKLMPVIAEDLPPHRLYRMHTVHNPVRIEPALDEDHPEYEERAIELESVLTSLDIVDVTGEEIKSLCDQVFPPRPEGWLKLYSVFGLQLHLPTHIVGETLAPGPFDLEPHRYAPLLLDGYLEKYTDGGLRLAAELIEGKVARGEVANYKLSLSVLDDVFATVERLIH